MKPKVNMSLRIPVADDNRLMRTLVAMCLQDIAKSGKRAMARKPTGAALKIFITPAVIVTASSQASGNSVTQR